MRWIKHLSMAHNDQAISLILEEMGPEGYGIYWLLLEHFASVMTSEDETVPILSHSEVKWSQICHCSVRTLRKFCVRASELQLISCRTLAEVRQYSGRTLANRLQIDIPKLLKYRDEYSKKSGHARHSKADTDTHTDKKKEIQKKEAPTTPFGDAPAPTPPLSKSRQEFEADWPHFWIRVGKESAYTAYVKARVRVSREKLMQSVREHGPRIVAQANREGRTPVHPATWLNAGRWDDDPAIYSGSNIRAGPFLDRKEKALAEFRRITNRDLEEHFAAQNH